MNPVKMTKRPIILSLAITSRCNLRCVMCDHGSGHVKKEDFDEALFDNIGDFIDTTEMLDLTGLGEPMLSSLFWKILDNHKAVADTPDEKFFITFNTNGTLLSEENIDRILSACISKIRISIDAADAETFGKIRGTSLAAILSGTRRLIEKRNALGRYRPRIGIEMTVMKETVGNVTDMIDLVKKIGADFIEIWSLNALPEYISKKWIVEKNGWHFSYLDQQLIPSGDLDRAVDGWYAFAKNRDIPLATFINGANRSSDGFQWAAGTVSFLSLVEPEWEENSIRCPMPWNEMRVLYNGEVKACCWQPGTIGDVNAGPLQSIWDGDNFREMRKSLIDGKIPVLCSGAACPYLQGKKVSKYSKYSRKYIRMWRAVVSAVTGLF